MVTGVQTCALPICLDAIGKFLGGTGRIRVIIAQYKLPAVFEREQPVEKRRTGVTNVNAAGGRRGEAYNGGHGRGR